MKLATKQPSLKGHGKAGRIGAAELEARQQAFILHYCNSLNATDAARQAGYSKKAARQQGARLLSNASISAEISRIRAKLEAKLEITAERTLEELKRIGYARPKAFFDADGKLKPIKDLTDEEAACICTIEVEKLYQHFAKGGAQEIGTITKYKFWPKVQACELLGKHDKLFTDRVELVKPLEKVPDDELADRIAALERDLGYANEIDQAGRTGRAQARRSAAAGAAKD